MVPVDGPQVQGAMMTPNGSYAVPVLDHQTYTQTKQNAPLAPIQEQKPEIPEDLLCSICSDLLTDAVMIPCCGNSFCDECIRSVLLESEDHECPDCHEKDITPVTLIPNRFLRNSVSNFKNTTGYIKKLVYKSSIVNVQPPTSTTTKKLTKDGDNSSDEMKLKLEAASEEKTVISEADSTEHSKNVDSTTKLPADFSHNDSDVVLKEQQQSSLVLPVHNKMTTPEHDAISEGPPGVSPDELPAKGQQPILKRVNSSREHSTSKYLLLLNVSGL